MALLNVDEFRKFLLRGNVVDLAVGVVIGVAFGAVVTSLVENIITPLIAAVIGEPDFSSLSFTINDSEILYGSFINALLSFLIVAAAIFYLVVLPMNHMVTRFKSQPATPEPTTRKCPRCWSEIPKQASRCSFCTADIEPVEVAAAT
ncbi:MAG: large conductance mechanosensitive channel protein MscL [Dehalococcoidia bacterium]|nr:large conductance mechanosensitive channel protein MscL [Dehalococcoidia bacterium]